MRFSATTTSRSASSRSPRRESYRRRKSTNSSPATRAKDFESVEDWRVAHERFFERPIEPDTLIEAVRFRLVEDG